MENKRNPMKVKVIIAKIVFVVAFVFLPLLLYIASGVYSDTFPSDCPPEDQAVFEEFLPYQPRARRSHENRDPRLTLRGGYVCAANFSTNDTPKQVMDYYREQLQDHDWKITRDAEGIENLRAFSREGVEQKTFSITAERSGREYYDIQLIENADSSLGVRIEVHGDRGEIEY